jgi:hypothetical protein
MFPHPSKDFSPLSANKSGLILRVRARRVFNFLLPRYHGHKTQMPTPSQNPDPRTHPPIANQAIQGFQGNLVRFALTLKPSDLGVRCWLLDVSPFQPIKVFKAIKAAAPERRALLCESPTQRAAPLVRCSGFSPNDAVKNLFYHGWTPINTDGKAIPNGYP